MKLSVEKLLLSADLAVFIGHLQEVPGEGRKIPGTESIIPTVRLTADPWPGNHRGFDIRKLDATCKKCGTHLQVLRGELYFLNNDSSIRPWEAVRDLFRDSEKLSGDQKLNVSQLVDPRSEFAKLVQAISNGTLTESDLK